MPLQISSNKKELQKRSQTPVIHPDDIPIKPMPKFDDESLGSGPGVEYDTEAITIPE
jgi:hypothetical protein